MQVKFMDRKEIYEILRSVESGDVSADEAVKMLRLQPFEDLGYARVDHHRALRQGVAEVIYGAGKTPEQIEGIARSMVDAGQRTIIITRMSQQALEKVSRSFEVKYNDAGRIGVIGEFPEPDGLGKIAIVTGGTSDIPVAEEAAVTAAALGNEVVRLYDVGVSGVHRLLSNVELIMDASVIIAIAGMEGALASVVGGLADCPVLAVPTSVGYGASFGGLSALLSMLNSCASGISVVNIDNGFGAGYMASMINHMGVKR